MLRQYFEPAMVFFFPQTAALIDWQRPHEFLDKELQQVAPDAEIGRRYADQLVKVWLLQGQEVWLCLHLEVQASRERDFAQRGACHLCKVSRNQGGLRHPNGCNSPYDS